LKSTPVDFQKATKQSALGVIRLIVPQPTKALPLPRSGGRSSSSTGAESAQFHPLFSFSLRSHGESAFHLNARTLFSCFALRRLKTILEVREASQIRWLMFYLSVQSVLFMQAAKSSRSVQGVNLHSAVISFVGARLCEWHWRVNQAEQTAGYSAERRSSVLLDDDDDCISRTLRRLRPPECLLRSLGRARREIIAERARKSLREFYSHVHCWQLICISASAEEYNVVFFILAI
jgi:hypothetical protein